MGKIRMPKLSHKVSNSLQEQDWRAVVGHFSPFEECKCSCNVSVYGKPSDNPESQWRILPHDACVCIVQNHNNFTYRLKLFDLDGTMDNNLADLILDLKIFSGCAYNIEEHWLLTFKGDQYIIGLRLAEEMNMTHYFMRLIDRIVGEWKYQHIRPDYKAIDNAVRIIKEEDVTCGISLLRNTDPGIKPSQLREAVARDLGWGHASKRGVTSIPLAEEESPLKRFILEENEREGYGVLTTIKPGGKMSPNMSQVPMSDKGAESRVKKRSDSFLPNVTAELAFEGTSGRPYLPWHGRLGTPLAASTPKKTAVSLPISSPSCTSSSSSSCSSKTSSGSSFDDEYGSSQGKRRRLDNLDEPSGSSTHGRSQSSTPNAHTVFQTVHELRPSQRGGAKPAKIVKKERPAQQSTRRSSGQADYTPRAIIHQIMKEARPHQGQEDSSPVTTVQELRSSPSRRNLDFNTLQTENITKPSLSPRPTRLPKEPHSEFTPEPHKHPKQRDLEKSLLLAEIEDGKEELKTVGSHQNVAKGLESSNVASSQPKPKPTRNLDVPDALLQDIRSKGYTLKNVPPNERQRKLEDIDAALREKINTISKAMNRDQNSDESSDDENWV